MRFISPYFFYKDSNGCNSMIFDNERVIRKIIALNIDIISYQQALTEIIDLGRNREPGYICIANVHMTIEAYHDPHFAEQVNRASLVLADGMPLVKAVKSFYGYSQERIAGMDLFPDLIREAGVNGVSVFFFGTTPDLLERIKAKTENEFPGTKIAGLLAPPFSSSLDDESHIQSIIDSGANLVFVALGCPKQEKWMARHSHKIKAPMVGFGGAFAVYAGTIKRAPRVMQNTGTEWLYRLYQEPRRLFKRYLMTNTLFLYLITKMKINQILGGRPSNQNLL